MPASLTTPRLSLVPLTPDDHAFIQELVNTDGWLRFIGDRQVRSVEEAQAYISRVMSNPTGTYWVVRLRTTAAPIGVVTFLKREYLEHFDIGFAFLPAYTGHGYAYEAARHVLALAKQQPEHAIVQATTVADNVNSQKLLTKLGLRFDRELLVEGNSLHLYSSTPPVNHSGFGVCVQAALGGQ